MGETTAPPEWLDVATDDPCRLYLATTGARCGRRPTRLYLKGRRCYTHAPAAITPALPKEGGPRG